MEDNSSSIYTNTQIQFEKIHIYIGGGEKPLWRTIQWAVLAFSLFSSVLVVVVLEDNLGFHKCIGREESFRYVSLFFQTFIAPLYRYNINDFFEDVGPTGLMIKGPIWRPVRLIGNLIFFAFVVLVPLLYWLIFRSPFLDMVCR